MKTKCTFPGLLIVILLIGLSLAAVAAGGDAGSSGGESLLIEEVKPPGSNGSELLAPIEQPRPGMEQALGLVREGQFYPVSVDENIVTEFPLRLTGIQMQEAMSPEAREINLYDFEGRAIMVEGRFGGGWVYSARVVDVAGPILTEVVKKLFMSVDAEPVLEEQ